jgi:hypothetical protein
MREVNAVESRALHQVHTGKMVMMKNSPAPVAISKKQMIDLQRILLDPGFSKRMKLQKEFCVPAAEKARCRVENAVLGTLNIHLDECSL